MMIVLSIPPSVEVRRTALSTLSRMSTIAPGEWGPRRVRNKILGLYAVLIGFNAVIWGMALLASQPHPALLGTALLAYTLGLRHAVDADHIAAIDNVTRKLMQSGQRPLSVGLYFSLGHSTVVFLASVGIAIAASALESRFQNIRAVGGAIGTMVSAAFLFAIAIANIVVLTGIYRCFRRVKQSGLMIKADLDTVPGNKGLAGRVLRPIVKMIGKPWHMYPLGFLFGLGFDTATEIGVLAISAVGAAQGLPIWTILIFPALFTAGMTLIDTTDSILMVGAYGWAFVKPIRKLYYNMTITFVSVAIALFVGGIEALGLIGDKLGLDRGLWGLVADLNANLGTFGVIVIGIFVLSWLVSALIYHVKGYDRIEVSST
jgi:high-affinity nickel-transport protein